MDLNTASFAGAHDGTGRSPRTFQHKPEPDLPAKKNEPDRNQATTLRKTNGKGDDEIKSKQHDPRPDNFTRQNLRVRLTARRPAQTGPRTTKAGTTGRHD